MPNASSIILISGGCRSGKSKYAEKLLSRDQSVTYIATFKNDKTDPSWSNRISEHKKRRPKYWNLIEDFEDINQQISSLNINSSLLIDSIGGIIYDKLSLTSEDWITYKSNFIDKLRIHKGTIILVCEMVSFGVTPIDISSNLFIDRLGLLSQDIEKIANYSYLLFNGKAIDLRKLYVEN